MLTLALALSLFAAPFPVHRSPAPDSALARTLISLENQSWTAWQRRDSAFFRHFLSEDHVELGFGGPTGKNTVVAGVGDPGCEVKSFKTERFRMTQFSANAALLVYRAVQLTVCHGVKVPSPVWVSSLYIFRDGRWQNAAYQQTPTTP